MIRAIRLELLKPTSESWDEVGPLLRTLAKATPKLLRAAYETRAACALVGVDVVKAKVAPEVRAASGDGIAYQGAKREQEALREWGEKKRHQFASLDVPGCMMSAISMAATQAFSQDNRARFGGANKRGRVNFTSERVLVKTCKVSRDEKGFAIAIKLRPKGVVVFAIAHSLGTHRETLEGIADGKIETGDCKLQYDEERRKWYALVSYDAPAREHPNLDPKKVLAVHRGIRNALFLLPSDGTRGLPLKAAKYMWQRKQLNERLRDTKRIGAFERGAGAKGHGKARAMATYETVGDKLARATHTFCQQSAAFVAETAIRLGCGTVVIEDYGGMPPDVDPHKRRMLDRFPLYEMKQCIASRLERDGIDLQETSVAYVSTTCPRCENVHPSQHNVRTGMFHCRACVFERPADWVAAFWMLSRSGADMTTWREKLKREKELGESMRNVREAAE